MSNLYESLGLSKPGYQERVVSALLNIFMEEEGVSEKSFSKVDELKEKCVAICKTNTAQISNFEAKSARVELCAEIIWFNLSTKA